MSASIRAFESRWVSVATMPGLVRGDRLGEFDEARDAAAARPDEPRVEQRDGLVGAAVEDEPEFLFEEVGAVEAAVDVFDRRELGLLAFGEPFGSLPERPAGAFEPAGAGLVAGAAGLLPDLAPHLVERAAGERDDVVGIEAERRLRAALPDRPGDPLAQVAGDEPDPAGALGAELVEEARARSSCRGPPAPTPACRCRGRRRR